jgi:hypothetical protein
VERAEDQTPSLNIGNVCNGAVPEIFERLLSEVMKNIADVNTDEEAKRSMVLKFTFNPYPARDGAVIELSTATKLAPVEVIKGNAFFSRRATGMRAYARDPKQAALFAGEQVQTPSQ